jgi:hypothetical protein
VAALEGIRADATPDEIRAEIAKRVQQLRDKGYLDALPEPQSFPQASQDGIASTGAQENQEVIDVDHGSA